MFGSGILLVIIIASAASHHIGDEADKQIKILDLVSGLGTEDVYSHDPKPFLFDDPNLFTNEAALRNFTTRYEEGFLKKDDVFSEFDKKTMTDVSSFADLLYFAKDFEVFFRIASWAKNEMNPVQYFYGLTSAVLHREDTSTINLPPVYEILPNYFVPSAAVNAAYRAKLNGIESRKFLINNTGWESGNDFNYYHTIRHMNNYNYDYESRLSYYREDVSRSDFFFKYYKKMDKRMNDESKYGFKKERLEEWYYTALKWILRRYNLERYAVALPPVQPLNLDTNIYPGYDSKIADMYGRSLSIRPDNVKPSDVDPQGSSNIKAILKRFSNYIESRYIHMMHSSHGSENITRNIINDDISYYSTLYHHFLGLIDGLSSSSNNKYFQGVLGNKLTRMRDPVYYQILASIDRIIQIVESNNQPYLKEELLFPGVKITDVTVSKLETYFEYYDFDISNAVPGKAGKYIASQFRINHKPFGVTLNIDSATETNAIVKMFLGPQSDTLNCPLNLNKLRESFTLMDTFEIKLNRGRNVIHRNPGQSELTSRSQRIKDIRNQIQSGKEMNQIQCSYPSHLLLPKGSPGGTPFKILVIVYPSEATLSVESGVRKTCGRDHLTMDKSHSLPFPVDKPWLPSNIQQPNIKFVDTFIHHSN